MGEVVELLDHIAAPQQPLQRQPVGGRQVLDAEGLLVGIAGDGEGVVGGRQIAARGEDRGVGNRDIGRQHPARRLANLGHHAAIARIHQGRRRAIAGQQVVGGPVVIGLGRGHAPDQGHTVHDLGQVGENLADLQAGDRRGDRLEFTPTSTAAAGLGSNVSMCDGPPASQIRMQFLTFAVSPDLDPAMARRRNHSSSPSPRKPSEPIRRTSRRLGPRHGCRSDSKTVTPSRRTIGGSIVLPFAFVSMVKGKFPRVQQRPEQVFGGLLFRGGVFELGRPVRRSLRPSAAGRRCGNRGSRRALRARARA